MFCGLMMFESTLNWINKVILTHFDETSRKIGYTSVTKAVTQTWPIGIVFQLTYGDAFSETGLIVNPAIVFPRLGL